MSNCWCNAFWPSKIITQRFILWLTLFLVIVNGLAIESCGCLPILVTCFKYFVQSYNWLISNKQLKSPINRLQLNEAKTECLSLHHGDTIKNANDITKFLDFKVYFVLKVIWKVHGTGVCTKLSRAVYLFRSFKILVPLHDGFLII